MANYGDARYGDGAYGGGVHSILAAGAIESQEAFGVPRLLLTQQIVYPLGIGSQEAISNPHLVGGIPPTEALPRPGLRIDDDALYACWLMPETPAEVSVAALEPVYSVSISAIGDQ